MRYLAFVLLTTLFAHSISAETEKERAARQAKELLAMTETEAKATIEKMSRGEAAEASSNILNQVRPRFKQADHVAYLLQHLAQIQATEREQKRLNNLLLVIFLTVALLAGFFIYVLLDQRRWMKQLSQILNSQNLDNVPPSVSNARSALRSPKKSPTRASRPTRK
ncbi:MAG: hypothetical protein JNM27_17810 [Leptospirales bacterium]|nr:hypothetical protein [Leptospirales bacterium]